MSEKFNAIIAEEIDGDCRAELKQIGLADLPNHDVLPICRPTSLSVPVLLLPRPYIPAPSDSY